ncbi:uncharacterized protein ALTATR162_LOCUS12032 [Alternaria atra]|uniref:Uncharacterized protein n=1 Tax=Alternaria atra TaxID=119953 RepID=A0A8J2II90_9PLEO|nr:uncharacterized protein ALTATR162_LOCUS12032 [Alternaria atra]CAG5188786.1 unnamed protein product [Alternaria atra]
MSSNDTFPEAYSTNAPLFPSAIIFPAFAFPAWVLCMAPMIWHFRQANIAAGSLILWIALHNFFNSVNALIWPRDNVLEWWDGPIWCDIHVRIQVGSYVGMTASVAMVIRKLAIVMDTRNMTVSTSRNSKIKAKIWEVVWCWVVPGFFIALYYVVQPVRYMIYGIVGCLSAHDSSWPSVVLGFMWPTIGMLFASYWAFLLVYRLYRYRREFHRLVAAQKTTSSRFVRLFILSLVVVLVYLSYSIYLLVGISKFITTPYSWSEVHDPNRFNNIIKVPVNGVVSFEKWVQVATGYITFCLLGTGVDANAHYRRMLVSTGAGKVWPSLYATSDGGSRAPKSFPAARAWTASVSSKAKSMLWSTESGSTSTGSTSDTFTDSTSNNSVILDSMPRLHSVTTQDTLISQKHDNSIAASTTPQPSFFKSYFARPSLRGPLLPLFSYRNIAEITTSNTSTISTIATNTNKLSTSSTLIGVHSRAWAADTSPSSSSSAGRHGYGNSVHVIREVHQQRNEKAGNEREEEGKEMKAWA